MSRLRAYFAGAMFILASAAILAQALVSSASPVALAAPALDSPTPTANPLLVPTAPAPASAGLTPSATSINPNGFAPVFTLSCATTIIGLVIAIVALIWLRRRGYSPFLRALLPERLRGPIKTAREPDARRPASGGRSRSRNGSQRWDDPPPRHRARRGSSRGSRS